MLHAPNQREGFAVLLFAVTASSRIPPVILTNLTHLKELVDVDRVVVVHVHDAQDDVDVLQVLPVPGLLRLLVDQLTPLAAEQEHTAEEVRYLRKRKEKKKSQSSKSQPFSFGLSRTLLVFCRKISVRGNDEL